MNDVIELRELRCSAVVGVLAEERDRAQPLSFDLDLVRPFAEAAISQLPSGPGNHASGVLRGSPLLRPTVVSTSASMFTTLPPDMAVATPLRRIRFLFHALNQFKSRPPGCFAPKVPSVGVLKLMTSPLA